MKLSDFHYELPEELIAQEPSPVRDKSRLMVLDRSDHSIREMVFSDIVSFFKNGDVLVLNDTRVIPARLFGTLKTGGHVEVFLLRKLEGNIWKTLVKPGKKLQIGTQFLINDVAGTVIDSTDDGGRIVEFDCSENELLGLGNVPLPPYIHKQVDDPERYQTVFSKNKGAVAAPTAGLHFTPELLSQIESIGVSIAKVTLHVGIGTFRPIKVDDIENHKMDFEWFQVSENVANSINQAKTHNGRIFACGTTVVRTLESSSTVEGFVNAGEGETDLFIKPGYNYRIVDKLITNFHLPGSTLLLLVSAFAGKDYIFKAYQQAIDHRFRFFSFGDAMMIL